MATSPTEFNVQSLYVGYLGRAAEISGRDFWVGNLDAGLVTLSQIATLFADSPEYKALYDGLTAPQFVSAVYRNVLGRPGEPSGLQFWTDKVTSGEIARDQLVLKMIEAMSAIDRVRFDTRVQDGNDYTEAAGANYVLADAQEAVALLNFLRASVDGSAATSVDEGQTVQFKFNTIDFFPGQTLTYTITGVSAADVVGGSLSGQITLDALNQAVVSITLAADALTEGPETLTLNLGGLSTPVTVNDTSTTVPPPSATYAIAAQQPGYDEGQSAVFDVVTKNVAAGTVLNFTITGVSTADVVGGTLSGTTIVGADGSAVISVGLVADNLTEGDETLTVTIDGTGASASTIVSDTSLTPVPSFAISSLQSGYVEGDTAIFNVATTNVVAGTVLNYTITGIQSEDVAGGLLAGTVVIGSDGKGVISVTLLADALTEGTETMTVTLDGTGASASATVSDTSLSPSYSVAADQGSVTEGDSATFTITTANVAAGTVVSYTIGGAVDAADIGGPLTGTATIGSDGKATITVPTVSDGVAEGPETLSVTVSAPGGITVSASTTLTDNAGFRLTSGQDGTVVQPAQAELFDGAQEQSPLGPLNTLNDSDVLEGVGGSAVLNAVLGNSKLGLTTPSMTDIDTVNVAFVSSLTQQFLSFQDTTGTSTANITRISGGLSAGFFDMNGEVMALSAADTVLPIPNLIYDYQAGKAPTTVGLVLEDVTVADINLGEGAQAAAKGGPFSSTIGTGITTLNLVSVGTNTIGTSTKDGLDSALTTLNLTVLPGMLTINGLTSATLATVTSTGAGDLVLNEVGKVAGFSLDASSMTGDVTAKIDNAAPDGGSSFKTGSGDDLLTTATALGGDITTDGGMDTVKIGGSMLAGSSIDTGDDADSITTGSLISSPGAGATISAGAGDDVVTTGDVGGGPTVVDSVIDLGEGDDSLTAGIIGGIVYGKGGADVISVASVTVGEVYGNEGADSIAVAGSVGGSSPFTGTVDGGAGNDVITVGGGVLAAGVVLGGDDDDVIIVSGGSKGTVGGGAGNDLMTISGGITGSFGNTVSGGSGMDYLVVSGAVTGTSVPAVDMGDDDDVYWQSLGAAGTAIAQGSAGVSVVLGGAPSASDTAVFDNTGAFALAVTNPQNFDGANALDGFETIQLLNRATGGAITAEFGEIGGTPRVDLLSFDGTTTTFNLTGLAGEPLFLTHDIEQGGNLPGIGAGSFDGFIVAPVVNTTNLNVAGSGGTLSMTIESPQSFAVNLDDTTGGYASLKLDVTNTTRSQTINFEPTLGSEDFGTSTTVTGSAAGNTITLNQIDSATITAVIDAHVNVVYGTNVGDMMLFDRDVWVTTGSGDDTVDARNIKVDGGNGAIGGTFGDKFNLGGGNDTVIIGNSTDVGPDRDEALEDWSGVENLWVDGIGTMVFLGDDATKAGIVNVKSMPGSMVTFETGGGFTASPLGVDLGLGSMLTLINNNNNPLAITANVDVPGAGTDGDVTLALANAGTGLVNLEVTIDRDTPTWVTGGAVTGGNGKSEVSVTVGAGGIDNITLIDSNVDFGTPGVYEPGFGDADNAKVFVATSNWGLGGAIKVDASGIDNFDGVSSTGAVFLDASAETGPVTLLGSANDNTLVGSLTAGNTLTGGAGNDVLIGGASADTLTGNGGNDSFFGGGGSDTLIGGSGNDFFVGGPGADTITTGGGSDVLDYLVASNSVASNSASRTHDKVMDFDFALDSFSLSVPVVGVGGLFTITEATGTLATYSNLASFLVSRAEIQALMLPAGVQALFVQILSPSFASGGINGATGDITLIIVDTNANDAYDPADLVVELDDDATYSNPAAWGLNNFGPFGNGMPIMTPAITAYADDTNIAGDDITSDTTLLISGTSDPFTSISVFNDGNGNGFQDWNELAFTTTASGAGTWSVGTSALADGTYTFHAQATIVDGNGSKFVSAPSAPQMVTVDTVPPSVTLTPDDLMLSDGETTTLTVQFSEVIDAASFNLSDILAGLSVDEISDTAVGAQAMAMDSAVGGQVNAGGDLDFFAISLVAGQSYQFNLLGTSSDQGTLSDPVLTLYDTDGTTLLVNNDDGGTGLESLITFDATVSGTYFLRARGFGSGTGTYTLEAIDLGASPQAGVGPGSFFGGPSTVYEVRGTLTGFTMVDGDTYTVVYTPTDNAEFTGQTFTIPAGEYTDIAGNAGLAGTSDPIDVDTLEPGVTITVTPNDETTVDGKIAIGETAAVTIVFSEAVLGFDDSPSDITVEGGSLTGLSTLDSITWTATFVPNPDVEDSTNVIAVIAGSYTDAVGNPGAGGASNNYDIDTNAPDAAGIDLKATDTGFSGSDNITSDTTPTMDPTGPGPLLAALDGNTVGGKLELYSSIDGLVGTDGFISFTEAFTGAGDDITASPLSDGVHDMWFVLYDTYGNSGKGDVLEVRIDTVAPGAPTIDLLASSDTGSSDSDNVTSDTSPTFRIDLTGTGAEEGDKVYLWRGALKSETFELTSTEVGQGYVDITDTFFVPPDGKWTFSASIEDIAGNDGAKSATLDVTIDSKAPTLTSVKYDAPNNTLVFTGTGLLTVDQGAVDIDGWIYDIDPGAFTYKFVSSDLVSITIVDDLTMRLEIVGSAASLIETTGGFGGLDDDLFVTGLSVVDLAGNAAPAGDTTFFGFN